MKSKTVVLIGSGHAHLEILKALTLLEISKHRFILISPNRQTYYSGMIPRFIAGEIEERSLTIHSADFAELKGFRFIQDEVMFVDQHHNKVILKSGDKIDFDLLSINVGGTAIKIPTDDPLDTIYLRPIDEFLPKWREMQNTFSANSNNRIVVVGGGAAAVEVAAALRKKLNKLQIKNSEVHLVCKGSRLCENYVKNISEKLNQSLLLNNVKIHLNEAVTHIHHKHLLLKQGGELKFDAIFIVTPTQPSKIVSGKVNSKLQVSSNVFAAGDGAEMNHHPDLPRSGLIAVHQGRHLVHSLRRVLMGQQPLDFKIKKNQLNILNIEEHSALLVWGNQSFQGKWPLRLKNWIDQSYVSSFKLDP